MSLEGDLVPAAGLEPARTCVPQILSLLCLPFHHAGKNQQHIRAKKKSKYFVKNSLSSYMSSRGAKRRRDPFRYIEDYK